MGTPHSVIESHKMLNVLKDFNPFLPILILIVVLCWWAIPRGKEKGCTLSGSVWWAVSDDAVIRHWWLSVSVWWCSVWWCSPPVPGMLLVLVYGAVVVLLGLYGTTLLATTLQSSSILALIASKVVSQQDRLQMIFFSTNHVAGGEDL